MIAIGILRVPLGRHEKWWVDIRLMLDMQIRSAVGFVLTVSWRFGRKFIVCTY